MGDVLFATGEAKIRDVKRESSIVNEAAYRSVFSSTHYYSLLIIACGASTAYNG